VIEMKIHNSIKLKARRKYLRNNMANAEVLMWTQLKGKSLSGYKFRRQHSVGEYILDFYNTALKLAIEN
jgi:very-short-patch-repair endonuclease